MAKWQSGGVAELHMKQSGAKSYSARVPSRQYLAASAAASVLKISLADVLGEAVDSWLMRNGKRIQAASYEIGRQAVGKGKAAT